MKPFLVVISNVIMNPETDNGGGEIEWPERPELVSPENWEAGKQVVGWLSELGEVSERCTNTSYTDMPVRYTIDGEKIMFLPRWTCYIISRNLLRRPTSKEEILCDIQAVKTFNSEYLTARRVPLASAPKA